jgi:lysylphosphatidylglycerol synthetase-like protein (DUF2156 family)
VLPSVDLVNAVPVFHALALPVGAGLTVIGVYLVRRRRRAWALALGLLVIVGFLNLLMGLDVEEASLGWALAVVLWWARPAFYVEHEPLGRRAGRWLAPALALGAMTLVAVAIWASRPRPSTRASGWCCARPATCCCGGRPR